MTPTEQDKELREQLIGISEATKPAWTDSAHFAVSRDGVATGFNIDELVNFITADRKRVALEARIDELENNKWLPNEAKWIEQEADRIAELKAQQEEL